MIYRRLFPFHWSTTMSIHQKISHFYILLWYLL